jgi:hypothetical protein
LIVDEIQLQEQIARCRRLAEQISDDEVRHSLERLAEEYEAELPRRADSFMLGSRSPKS